MKEKGFESRPLRQKLSKNIIYSGELGSPVYSRENVVVLDADGTTIDAFKAIGRTFACHDMDIGDLERFR